jgi:4-amino-4-deoxy-L-arabinose transferase-like glycosyltransferase
VRATHVLAVAALLFVWNVWGYDLWAPDEPYFAEGAREMVVDGQWAVPHVNGVVTTDKPPLFFWLIALVSLPFGQVSSLTARLPSTLAMLAATALTMRLARRFSGETAGPLAGLIFATTYLVWDKGRTAQIDALLCALILVALSAFEAFRAGDAGGRRAGIAFWSAAALATLAKGPVGLAIPLGVALVTLAADRNLRAWRRFAPLTGPVAFLGIVATWMAVATIGGHGEYSVWGAFQKHVLDRAVHGMHHKQAFWYYARVIPAQLVPWTALAPAAIVLAFKRRDAGDRFLLAWAAFVVIFFSIPVEKRDLYVLPAYPAFAILAARLVEALEAGGAAVPRRFATIPQGILSAFVFLLGVAIPFVIGRTGFVSTRTSLLPALALALTGAVSLTLILRGRLRGAVTATIAGITVAYLATATLVFPVLNPIKSARGFAERLAALSADSRSAGHTVVAFDVGNLPQALALYSNGLYTNETSDPAVLERHLAQEARVFAVVNATDLDRLSADARGRLVVLHQERLAGRPVVLVVNR